MRRSITLSICLSAAAARAQPDPQPPKPDEPEPEAPPTLEARVKALEVDLKDAQGETADLRSEVGDLKAKLAAAKPPTSPSVFNPAITAFLNGAVRTDDRKVLAASGARIDDRPFLRTAEVDFRAAADPYADAVAILAIEDEAGEGFAADLEEGYVIVKQIPVLDKAPLGLKLKLGRYRAPIGNVNRLHMHDLPWTTRPLAISRLLGSENGEFFEAGYNPVGVDAEFFLPTIVKGVVQEVNLDVVDGGNIAIADAETVRRHRPAYLGHYNLFFTVGDDHDISLGASGYYDEEKSHRAWLVGGDFLYKWKPAKAGEFKSFVLGGEVLYANRRFALDDMTEVKAKPLAWFGFAQYQLSWHVYAGARYDYAEDIDDPSIATKVAAGYLSYYTSEFLRFRAGYEHRWSDNPADDGVDSVFAEINVVFGSHPTEPYWVNR